MSLKSVEWRRELKLKFFTLSASNCYKLLQFTSLKLPEHKQFMIYEMKNVVFSSYKSLTCIKIFHQRYQQTNGKIKAWAFSLFSLLIASSCGSFYIANYLESFNTNSGFSCLTVCGIFLCVSMSLQKYVCRKVLSGFCL